MKTRRAFILIIDMLPGHWAQGVVAPATGLPPPNVEGYVNAGRLPVFQDCLRTGVFVRSWNRGICNTHYGQWYLANGAYQTPPPPQNQPGAGQPPAAVRPTILTACKSRYPDGKVASFGSNSWMQTGWWKAQDATFGWGSYYSDLLTAQYCFKWMLENPDWKMVLLYLAQYDQTGNCPLYRRGAGWTQDKHHSLLELDRMLWLVKRFLGEKGWWPETYLFIGSDHGCHYGCDVAVAEGRQRGVAGKELANYCSNHQPPFDCRLWDFRKNRATSRRSACARRTTFLINGGALDPRWRGRVIPRGAIIDFAPTIARLMGIPFPAEGRSVL